MNKYRYSFKAECPTDGDAVAYVATIETRNVIKAEDIREVCNGFKRGFHEAFADSLHRAFGGRQTIAATHRSVHITTTRGAL